MTTVMIHVTPNVAKENLHEYDLEVGSLYRVVLDDAVTENIADAALDVFHSNVAIKQLDDFNFVPKDEAGNTLDIDLDYDSYSEERGYVDLLQM